MPEQYVATDKVTGVEVAVKGEFPPHPDDRMRIARTTTLFTRLMATLLAKPEAERRVGFRAVETQLELADAMIRQDADEVRRLVRRTLETMGVGDEQLREMARQMRELSGLDPAVAEELAKAFGLDVEDPADPPEISDEEAPPDDRVPFDHIGGDAPSGSEPSGGGAIEMPPPASSYDGPPDDTGGEGELPEKDEDDADDDRGPAAPA